MNTITLRPYRQSDAKELENIIRSTWNYDRFASPGTAAKLARVYLYSCLSNQTFTQVAVVNDRPAGIIMGKNIDTYKRPLRFRIRQLCSIISLLISREGRKVSKIFANVDGIDKELLKECQKTYHAEIAFFAVNSKYRGQGIGKKLFHAFLEYINAHKIDEFYLYTDTSCNYRFYEHQGMSRRCQKTHTFQIAGQQSEMMFFLYDYHLSSVILSASSAASLTHLTQQSRG